MINAMEKIVGMNCVTVVLCTLNTIVCYVIVCNVLRIFLTRDAILYILSSFFKIIYKL